VRVHGGYTARLPIESYCYDQPTTFPSRLSLPSFITNIVTTFTTSVNLFMFKKLKKHSGSNPNTPKIAPVPLPEVSDQVVLSLMRNASPRVRWTDECMSDGELWMKRRRSSVKKDLHSKISPADVPVRPAAPKPSVDCGLQSINLHWLLLPFEAARGKPRLSFDIRFRVERIRLWPLDLPCSCPLGVEYPTRFATDKGLKRMTIICKDIPWWEVRIRRPDPICVQDVLEEIHQTFYERLTASDHGRIPPDRIARCENAFKDRCKTADALEIWEQRQGLRRVDLLRGKTLFMGLVRPPPNEDQTKWQLQFGRPGS